ncbi:hypothetical protein HK100_006580 [Physocladia obscura]|uniref:Uncharacterized protein n=1 Tax=Physocladia obscura TaxID=109957 RepID=A0AAD5XB99_9FUNG|nr:hypothetical protein HK100_006580 [Physocladia obscura]
MKSLKGAEGAEGQRSLDPPPYNESKSVSAFSDSIGADDVDFKSTDRLLFFVSQNPHFHALLNLLLLPAVQALVRDTPASSSNVLYLISESVKQKAPQFVLQPSQTTLPFKYIFVPPTSTDTESNTMSFPQKLKMATISPEFLDTSSSSSSCSSPPSKNPHIDVSVFNVRTADGKELQVLAFKNNDGSMTYRVPNAEHFELLPDSTQAAIIHLISFEEKLRAAANGLQDNLEKQFSNSTSSRIAVTSFDILCNPETQQILAGAIQLYIPGVESAEVHKEELLIRRISDFGLVETEVHSMIKISIFL